MGSRLTFGIRAIAALATALMLAGCASAKAKQIDPEAAFIQPTGFTETTSSVDGVVVDEEFQPLANSIVGFIDPYQATKTDEFGHFEIGMIDKLGPRNLYVIHLGHKSAGKRIELVANQMTTITFVLPVLPVEEPWIDIVHTSGWFERSLSIRPVTAYNTTSSPAWKVKDDPKVLNGLHMDVVWQQQQGLSGGLQVRFELGGSSREAFFTLAGSNPLQKSIGRSEISDVFNRSKGPCVKEPCRFEWHAEPYTSLTGQLVDAAVMVDQRFDVWVAHAYRMNLPENYDTLNS